MESVAPALTPLVYSAKTLKHFLSSRVFLAPLAEGIENGAEAVIFPSSSYVSTVPRSKSITKRIVTASFVISATGTVPPPM